MVLKGDDKCGAERRGGSRERNAVYMLLSYEGHILQGSFIKVLLAWYALSKCSSYFAKAHRFIPLKF